jgi:fructose-1,6-bisphosphatase/inositol monophosphatase family enzyme
LLSLAEDSALQSHLITRGHEAIVAVQHRLLELRHQPEWAAVRVPINNLFAASGRDTTLEDHQAESTARAQLEKLYPAHREVAIEAIGEERMKSDGWRAHGGLSGLDAAKTIIALVDPLDGTKLEAREIPTWCIAIVFYERSTGRVLAALVGQATGSIYCATATPLLAVEIDSARVIHGDDRRALAWRQVPNPKRPRQDGWYDFAPPEELRAPDEASRNDVAFVASSPRSFLLASRFVEEARKSDETLLGRVYNMGGNPMLAKVANGTIDAVVGFGDVGSKGTTAQKPHDYIPGAFIAQQAGGTVIDTASGEPLDFARCLLRPDEPGQRYVVARTRDVAERCLRVLRAAGLAAPV